MSVFKPIRIIAINLGFYGAARWFYRHFLKRSELRALDAECALYRHFVRPGDLVFDVGANVGAKSEVFLRLGARVIAFEPQPAVHRELLARCGRAAQFTLVPCAMGSEAGEATLHITSRNSGEASLLAGWVPSAEAAIKVPVKRLDAFIAEYGVPAFCKIDVEGFELQVFQGMSAALPALSFEYHMSERGIAKVLGCLEYLSRFGGMGINFVADRMETFGLPEWADCETFTEFMQRDLRKSEDWFFGDIFVRFQK